MHRRFAQDLADRQALSNEIRNNLVGIELEKVKETQITGNILDNVVTNVDEK